MGRAVGAAVAMAATLAFVVSATAHDGAGPTHFNIGGILSNKESDAHFKNTIMVSRQRRAGVGWGRWGEREEFRVGWVKVG